VSKTVQITVRMTPELWHMAETAMMKGKFRNMNEFLRACVRFYIDETDDVMGSRRHFNKTLGQRMDRLEALTQWNVLHTQMLTARGIYTVLHELTPEDVDAEPPLPDMQIQLAIEGTKRLLPRFLEEQEAIIDQLAQHLNRRHAARAEKTDARAKAKKA